MEPLPLCRAAIIALCFSAGIACAQAVKLDAKSTELIQQADAVLAKANTVSLVQTRTMRFVSDGELNGQQGEVMHLTARRPGSFRMTKGDGEEFTVSDGKVWTRYMEVVNAYQKTDVSKYASDQLFRAPNPDRLANTGRGLVSLWLGRHSLQSLLPGDASYTGVQKEDGNPFHTITVKNGSVMWRLYLSAETPPLPARLISLQPQQVGDAKVVFQMEITFADWRFDPPVEENSFVFAAPDGAREVQSLEAAMAEEYEARMEEPAIPKGKPLPKGGDVHTRDEFRAEFIAWYTPYIIAAYRGNGHCDAKWDADMEELFHEWAKRITGASSLRHLVELREKALYIQSLGCHDPYLEYLLANFTQFLEGTEAARPLIAASWEAIRNTSYPPTLRGSSLWRYMGILKDRYRKEKKLYQELTDEFVDIFAQSTAEPAYRNGNQRFHCYLFDGAWNEIKYPIQKRIFEEMKTVRDADPCLLAYTTGFYHITAAWSNGDDGYQPPDGGPRGFLGHMAQAHRKLSGIWESQPSYSASAIGALMSLGRPSDNDARRLWFDRAIAVQFDDHAAYDRLRWAYGRWGGGADWVYELGLEAAATGRFDTEAPVEYWNSLLKLNDDFDESWSEILARPKAIDTLVGVCDGYGSKGSRKHSPEYWQSLKLVCCWITGRRQEAMSALERLNGMPEVAVCEDMRVDMDQIIAETRLLSGPHAKDGQAALDLLAQGKLAEGVSAMRQLVLACQDEAPSLATYLGTRICDIPFSAAPEAAETILDTMIELHMREAVVQSFVRWMARDQDHVPAAFQDRVARHVGPICWELMQEAPTSSTLSEEEIVRATTGLDALSLADIPGADTLAATEANDLLATERALAKLRLHYCYHVEGRRGYEKRKAYCRKYVEPVVDSVLHRGLLIDFMGEQQRRWWRWHKGDVTVGMEDWPHVQEHADYGYLIGQVWQIKGTVHLRGPAVWDGQTPTLQPDLDRLAAIANPEEQVEQAWAYFRRCGTPHLAFQIKQTLEDSGCRVAAARMERLLIRYFAGLCYPSRDVRAERALARGFNAIPGYENRVMGYAEIYWTDWWYVPEIRISEADAALRMGDLDRAIQALVESGKVAPHKGWLYAVGMRHDGSDQASTALVHAIASDPSATPETLTLLERLFPERLAEVPPEH